MWKDVENRNLPLLAVTCRYSPLLAATDRLPAFSAGRKRSENGTGIPKFQFVVEKYDVKFRVIRCN